MIFSELMIKYINSREEFIFELIKNQLIGKLSEFAKNNRLDREYSPFYPNITDEFITECDDILHRLNEQILRPEGVEYIISIDYSEQDQLQSINIINLPEYIDEDDANDIGFELAYALYEDIQEQLNISFFYLFSNYNQIMEVGSLKVIRW